MSLRWAGCLAASLIGATIAATWFLSGVAVGEAARFLAFEALYVVLPGCSLYLVLMPRRGGWLRVIAIGWPLGYAIEIGAFALTASLHQRSAFALLPLISIPLIAVFVLRRRRQRLGRGRSPTPRDRSSWQLPRLTSGELGIVAAAISGVLILLALEFFTAAPLPGHFRSIVYLQEDVYAISLAAEARNHWPITVPWVAGLPLRYYTAAFMHGAAINQVGGVPLSTIYMRLLPATATVGLSLQLWCLGRAMGRSRAAGPLAIVLFFVVGSATLNPRLTWPFEGETLPDFWGSASFRFAAPFLLGLLLLIQRWLGEIDARTERSARTESRLAQPAVLREGNAGAVLILAALVLGCAAAKAFAAVDFIGGLGLFLLWGLLTRRLKGPAVRLLACLLGISAACLGVIYVAMLAGSASKLVRVQPIHVAFVESIFTKTQSVAQSIVGHSALWIVVAIVGFGLAAVCMSAPVLGAAWLLLRRRVLSYFEVYCLSVLLVGVALFYATSAEGGELYFRYFGSLALTPVVAGGLSDFWIATPKGARRAVISACGVILAFGLAIPSVFFALGSSHHTELSWTPVTYGAIVVVLAAMVFRLRRHYAAVVSSRLGSIAACCIPLLVAFGLVKSGAIAAFRAEHTVLRQRVAERDSSAEFGMTDSLYQGLLWVRNHTHSCNVLAVNNHYASHSRMPTAYLYYSAFTERRIYLESWGFTPSGLEGRTPDPQRLVLSDSAIQHGKPGALRALARDGVSYVLVDTTHGKGASEPARVSRLVFSNNALKVYRLLPRSHRRHPLGCAA